MADDIGDKLREMAEHRGLKLVKSRRRKPGTGDFGKFGLTDAAGRPLLGMSDAGLMASPEDIETYLRQGATSTWKASADAAPERSSAPKRLRRAATEDEDKDSPSMIRPRARRAGEKSERRADRTVSRKTAPTAERANDEKEPGRPATRRRSDRRPVDVEFEEPRTRAKSISQPALEPEAKLVIRAARSADAAALAPLLAQLAHIDIDELAIARNLDAARKAKGGMAVAELSELVGFCGWATLSTVQHGLIGRITLLLVDERYRRQGIATALLEAATDALGKVGCVRLEVMSDIEIANAHGFFRSLGFEQTSYRFARGIGREN